MDERSGKATGSYGDFGGFGGFGAGQGRQNYSEDEQHMMAAVNYIRARRYNEALNVLNGISNHNAAWYYYSSIANMGLGNNNVALEQAKQAMDMEPGNMQYRQYYQQLQNGGGFYGGSHLEVRLAAVMAVAEAMAVMEVMAEDMIPVEPEISVVISGVPTRCVNVWEAIFVHACRADKKNSRSGNVTALSVLLLAAGSFVTVNTLFLTALAGISCGICYLSLWTARRIDAVCDLHAVRCLFKSG